MRPDHALAHYNLALVLKRVDRAKDAIAALQRALAIQPRAEAHFALGTLYFHQGDFDRAIAALKAAVAAEPRLVDAHIALGSVFKAKRQLPEAIDALRRAIALQPDSWSAHAALATVLQQAGAKDAAAQEAAEAERRRLQGELEREAAALTAVGIARLDADDAAAAAEQFRRAIARVETYAPAHYQLGRALQRLGQDGAARAAFARAHALNPSLRAAGWDPVTLPRFLETAAPINRSRPGHSRSRSSRRRIRGKSAPRTLAHPGTSVV